MIRFMFILSLLCSISFRASAGNDITLSPVISNYDDKTSIGLIIRSSMISFDDSKELDYEIGYVNESLFLSSMLELSFKLNKAFTLSPSIGFVYNFEQLNMSYDLKLESFYDQNVKFIFSTKSIGSFFGDHDYLFSIGLMYIY
ncbi:hypothetical protein ACVTNF_001471 [Photobacterium damselae]